jgi:hypothetical protein
MSFPYNGDWFVDVIRRQIDAEAVKWAQEEALKLAGQPRPRTRPLADFLRDLKDKRQP